MPINVLVANCEPTDAAQACGAEGCVGGPQLCNCVCTARSGQRPQGAACWLPFGAAARPGRDCNASAQEISVDGALRRLRVRGGPPRHRRPDAYWVPTAPLHNPQGSGSSWGLCALLPTAPIPRVFRLQVNHAKLQSTQNM